MPGSLITAEWYSEALGRPTQINVILPPSLAAGTYQPGHKFKTVYLLPGALSNSDALFTELDLASGYDGRTLDDVAVISVTPTFSNYTDYQLEYRYAHQYYTYVTKELLEMTRTLFPLSDRREDTAIYGFSMGGWGAFFCGLNNPKTYGYVGAQSGMLDMQWAVDNRPFMTVKHKRQFGNLTVQDTKYDLFAIARRLDKAAAAGETEIPKIYQSWGGEKDYLNTPNVHMHEHLKQLKHLDYTCCPGDWIHSWGPHNKGVYLFLDWFLSGETKGGEA